MAGGADKRCVVHLLLGDYSLDSRVRNETEALADGYDVHVLCYGKPSVREARAEEIRAGVHVISQKKAKGLLGLLLCWWRLVGEALALRPVIVHAHDVHALPLGYVMAKLTGEKLIYDSHELWSQAHHNPRAKIILDSAKWIERFIGKRTDGVITVSDSIARYLKTYFAHDHIWVIRNIPTYMRTDQCAEDSRASIRASWQAEEGQLVVMYQGVIKRERGVFVIAEAIKSLANHNILMVFLGSGSDRADLQAYVEAQNISHLVRFQEAVQQDVLACYTKSADLGVHAIQNSCLNHDYCLPNKLFEYIKCGLPVVVTDLTEMRAFVHDHAFGLTFADGDCEDLANNIAKFCEADYRSAMASNVQKGQDQVSEAQEYAALGQIYEELIS